MNVLTFSTEFSNSNVCFFEVLGWVETEEGKHMGVLSDSSSAPLF